MVSVIFDVVSVWLVIEPCVKFGTTGTARAVAPVNRIATALIAIDHVIFPEWVIAGVLSQLQ